MIFNFVKPSAIQHWISVNAVGSLNTAPGDSWRAYLVAGGATGTSTQELEASFLSAQTGGTVYDKWQTYLAANGGGTGDPRDKFQSKYN